MPRPTSIGLGLLTLLLVVPSSDASPPEPKPVMTMGGIDYYSWADYHEAILRRGTLCGVKPRTVRNPAPSMSVVAADCSASQTNPSSDYDEGGIILIDVVFHIIMKEDESQGVVPDERVHEQIQILNEDFEALAGTNGENGTNTQFRFRLATVDPEGNPTAGITRSHNDTWYFDTGSYWNTLAWDTNRYLNIYSNSAGPFAIGYVPQLPADGGGSIVGTNEDRVVLLWSTIGRNAPYGPPFHLGRTATHEVGHYLGLEHTFGGGCGTATAPDCYISGDLICDTNPQSNETYHCPVGATSCGGFADPIDNYMNYTDDDCMEMFTLEQSRRMRCTQQFWRPDLATPMIFQDGFESGDVSTWSEIEPP